MGAIYVGDVEMIAGLRQTAAAIAQSTKSEGAIVITSSEEGYSMGVAGLDDHSVQEALCVGIHLNFVQMDEAG